MNIINMPGWQVVTVKETGHDYMVSATYSKKSDGEFAKNWAELGS